MKELVRIKENDVFTNSLIIAENALLQHHSVTRILRNHIKDFEFFGSLRFMDLKSKNSNGGRPIKVYELNEQQATLLLTYLDNTVTVRLFKRNLVDQFFKMRFLLLERQSSEWLQTRKHGKMLRRQETDVISELIIYAKKQGSKNADMLYMNYSKLVNSLVGIKAGQRELATEKVLSVIALIEDLILNTVQEEMSAGVYYKEIYQHCKAKAASIMQYVYLPVERLLIA
ncbi:Rha family transcriptional regulator [Paenibacillus sp. F4]|uniref:Rha family transcriptional regulator n=1 Tax=Paenibacillus sp. F4 TaxID=357385 RepID=UPI000C9F29AC|nr:Rha family transcriptional regulator [Paenibacillus sp. F4]PNQ78902.1 hypothetical protein C1T21_22920 [Paenibacillus sp. F4]